MEELQLLKVKTVGECLKALKIMDQFVFKVEHVVFDMNYAQWCIFYRKNGLPGVADAGMKTLENL